jgi:hypothetical protein
MIKTEEKCPYSCIEGKVFDTTQKIFVPCPHCSSKMNKIVTGVEKTEDGKDINDLLRIPPRYKCKEFSLHNLMPDYGMMDSQSVQEVIEALDMLVSKARIADLPDYSIMFNLGASSDILNFIFHYLKICLVGGLTVCPVVSSSDIFTLRGMFDGNETKAGVLLQERLGLTYLDLESREVCVVTIDAGARDSAWFTVKGLLEGRERNGLPTIIFTNEYKMLSKVSQQKSLHSATLVGVKYLLTDSNSSLLNIIDLMSDFVTKGKNFVQNFVADTRASDVVKSLDLLNKDILSIDSSLSSEDVSLSSKDLESIRQSFKDIVLELSVFNKLTIDRSDNLNIPNMLNFISSMKGRIDSAISGVVNKPKHTRGTSVTMSSLNSYTTNPIASAHSIGKSNLL